MNVPLDFISPLELGFCVRDLQCSVAFYRDILGFTVVSSIVTPEAQAVTSGLAESGYTVVRLQLPTGERLKLFKPDRPVVAFPKSAVPLGCVSFAFITLIVRDIAATLQRLSQHGVKARSSIPYRLRDNVLIALVNDPDGNVIEFAEYMNFSEYRQDV